MLLYGMFLRIFHYATSLLDDDSKSDNAGAWRKNWQEETAPNADTSHEEEDVASANACVSTYVKMLQSIDSIRQFVCLLFHPTENNRHFFLMNTRNAQPKLIVVLGRVSFR